MSRLAGINKNDVVNGEGICVSVFLQGCPWRCKGCHNPETWFEDGGEEIQDEDLFINNILYYIKQNGILRNFSLLGGEPLYDTNIKLSLKILEKVKETYPTIKTYVWTGATMEWLETHYEMDKVLENIDVLIVGPYIEGQRDITLNLRGSKNQQVLYKSIDF